MIVQIEPDNPCLFNFLPHNATNRCEGASTMSDERLKKSAGDNRESLAMQDRTVTENREISDDERVEMFRQQFFQSSLPDLPSIPGWHMCWLTTTNPRDSIQIRIRLGYQPVKPEEVPGWEYATLKTGDWAGFIGVNEMLAFKLPMSLYEKYMLEAHHNAPLREEEKLTDTAEFLEQQARASKSKLQVGEGNMEIGKNREARFDLS
jgi:hypothetical protein